MLRAAALFFLLSCSFCSLSQKNALGFAVGYGNFKHKTWDALQDTYHQTFDTIVQPHPYLRHLPGASLVYEHELAEYLYVQPTLQCQYASTVSGNSSIALRLKAYFLSAGVNVNWYPVKMAKGLRKSPLNPLYLRIGIGASYSLNSITRDEKVVYDDSTKSARSVNLCIFTEAGLGYDLHFGKRLVVQPFAGLRLYPNMGMLSMAYFIDRMRRYDLEDTGLAREARIYVTLLYLF